MLCSYLTTHSSMARATANSPAKFIKISVGISQHRGGVAGRLRHYDESCPTQPSIPTSKALPPPHHPYGNYKDFKYSTRSFFSCSVKLNFLKPS